MDRDRDSIRHEDSIVWTEDIEQLDYVREHLDVFAATRRQPVPWRGPGRRVGYSVLRSDAPAGEPPTRFARRVFWVKEHDRSEQPSGLYKTGTPAEGVDPRTVAPGVWGEVTDRALGTASPGSVSSSPRTGRRRGRPRKDAQAEPATEIRVGRSSLAGGSAVVAVTPIGQGRIEIFIDCASGTTLGDGTHVISEVMPENEARALLADIVKSTPWLREAMALWLVDQWVSKGTAIPEA